MRFERLKLTHFKNYVTADIILNPRINCFVGWNGMGKTNVLDAIYYCCIGKSFFSSRDTQVLQQGEQFFRIEAYLGGAFLPASLGQTGAQMSSVVVKVIPAKLKEIEVDNRALERSSDLAGRCPVVMISTQDDKVILEGGTARRRFLNNVLSQLSSKYLQSLAIYHKLLRKRNSLLKDEKMSYADRRTLATAYSEQMTAPAQVITEARNDLIPRLKESFVRVYDEISNRQESVDLQFRSDLCDRPLLDIHMSEIESDMRARRTLRGIHRDDLLLSFDDKLMKDYGSQGQIKTCVISLKLAQYQILTEDKGVPPIVLLDDIFDRLDTKRVESLLDFLTGVNSGQIFITDTDRDRVSSLMSSTGVEYGIYEVNQGKIALVQA